MRTRPVTSNLPSSRDRQKKKEAPQKSQAAKEAAKIVLARRNLVDFAEAILRDQNGNPIKAVDIHRSWADHLQYCWQIGKAGVILAPYSFGKSAWMAQALPLWLLGQNPNLVIQIVSSAEEIAAKRVQKLREYITKSPEYQRIFPWVKLEPGRPNTAHALNIVREGERGGITGSVDGSVAAYGYTSSEGQGSRTDVLIFDDVADEKNSCISQATRKNLAQLVTSQWLPRAARPMEQGAVAVKSRDGRVIAKKPIICAIGTRFHEEDIYGFFLKEAEGFCTLVQGVSDDFTHLDVQIVGALKQPPHPVLTKFRDYVPNSMIGATPRLQLVELT